MTTLDEIHTYYALPGAHTEPGELSSLLADLPSDIPSLVQVVQGLLIHVFWASRYGRELSEAEKATLQVRPLREKLALMQQVNPAPLTQTRPLEQRQVGNCRDFSLLLTAFLRHQGVPARARCGFGTYFMPDHFEDHWVVQYWHADQARWVMVDAQLDAFQQEKLKIDFDPLDMPYHIGSLESKFIPGGDAYRLCISGQADPEKFGIFDMHGLDFIRGDLVRDFLALNKVEILPWDWGWGYLTPTKFADLRLFDHLSTLLVGGDASFAAIRRQYESDPSLQMPAASPEAKTEVTEP